MNKLTQAEAVEVQKGLFVLAVDILLRKRKDYSGENDPFGNLRVAAGHGVHPVVGVNIRTNDKLVRVSHIVQAGKVAQGGLVGEKVIDDLRDVVNYTCIAAGLLAEEDEETKATLLDAAARFKETMDNFSV